MQYLFAFLVGGVLCVIAQLLIDKTSLTPARILVTYVVSGVVLTALGLYEPLISFAGAAAMTFSLSFERLANFSMSKSPIIPTLKLSAITVYLLP